jgi:hypothetical protein
MADENYRRHAAECVRLAQLTRDPEAKALLLKMVDAWLRLAENAEQQKPEPQSE